MPLMPQQITRLAEVFNEEWDHPKLISFASDYLSVDLSKLPLSVSLKERALLFISDMNSNFPPRDRELLEQLRLHSNARLKAVANELLAPTFYSPTGDPHDAIVLGRAAFVDRSDLRSFIREFTNPTPFSTRVLIVRGDQPCGKSYSWEFVRHLAVSTVGAVPQRLHLKNTAYTPRQLFERVGTLLRLDTSRMPPMSDDPQLARIDPLIIWFQSELPTLTQAYWLVIDDLNDPSVTPAMRDAVYALAYCVEEAKQNLWVALLGYNEPIIDSDLRFIAQESARFPDAALVAKHFEDIAMVSPKPLTLARAQEIADLFFTEFPKIDKETMIKLTMKIEKMGELLKLGQQP